MVCFTTVYCVYGKKVGPDWCDDHCKCESQKCDDDRASFFEKARGRGRASGGWGGVGPPNTTAMMSAS